jgi:hypothetical protein
MKWRILSFFSYGAFYGEPYKLDSIAAGAQPRAVACSQTNLEGPSPPPPASRLNGRRLRLGSSHIREIVVQ